MKEQFVTYEIAKELKELGFDEICIACYITNGNEIKIKYEKPDYLLSQEKAAYIFDYEWHGTEYNTILAPLWQQAIDWFREKHQIFIHIKTDATCEPKFGFSIYKFIGNPKDLTKEEWYWENPILNEYLYRTYEEAREEGIIEAFKLIKN